MKLLKYFAAIVFLFQACSSLTLKPADFSWPVESVLKVSDDGFVKEERHAMLFDTRSMFLEETEDSSAYLDKEVRIIRDTKGYYFITSDNFKNVYVFNSDDGELCLENKINISEVGMNKPVFNQRQPYIEVIYGSNNHLLSNDGIKSED